MTEELNLKDLFTNFIKFNMRNKKIIFLIVLFGVCSVILYQKLKKPYYETKAICMSGISEYERPGTSRKLKSANCYRLN